MPRGCEDPFRGSADDGHCSRGRKTTDLANRGFAALAPDQLGAPHHLRPNLPRVVVGLPLSTSLLTALALDAPGNGHLTPLT